MKTQPLVAQRYTVADLLFDPEAHTSTLPDGRDVPHVTAVLAAVGVATDFEEIAAMSQRAGRMIEFARARGSAVHADCHAYDDDDLDPSAVDLRVLPFVDAWAQCRRDKGLVPLAHARERLLYHPIDDYAGILDGVFGFGALRVLIDLKTGDPEDAGAHQQTAAYEGAWTFEHPQTPIHQRWAVWLRPGLRVPYRIINYADRTDGWQDYARWQASLCTYREQPARRRRIA